MIIFNESLTTVEKTDMGYSIKSPLYSFNSNTIPDPLTLESLTDFIHEARRDKYESIKADFSAFADTYLKPINEN